MSEQKINTDNKIKIKRHQSQEIQMCQCSKGKYVYIKDRISQGHEIAIQVKPLEMEDSNDTNTNASSMQNSTARPEIVTSSGENSWQQLQLDCKKILIDFCAYQESPKKPKPRENSFFSRKGAQDDSSASNSQSKQSFLPHYRNFKVKLFNQDDMGVYCSFKQLVSHCQLNLKFMQPILNYMQNNAKKNEDKGKIIDIQEALVSIIHFNYDQITQNYLRWFEYMQRLSESLKALLSNEPRVRRQSFRIQQIHDLLNNKNPDEISKPQTSEKKGKLTVIQRKKTQKDKFNHILKDPIYLNQCTRINTYIKYIVGAVQQKLYPLIVQKSLDNQEDYEPILHGIYAKKWQTWVEYERKKYLNICNDLEKNPPQIICRICETKVDAGNVQSHCKNCIFRATQRKKIVLQDLEVNLLCDQILELRQKTRKDMNHEVKFLKRQRQIALGQIDDVNSPRQKKLSIERNSQILAEIDEMSESQPQQTSLTKKEQKEKLLEQLNPNNEKVRKSILQQNALMSLHNNKKRGSHGNEAFKIESRHSLKAQAEDMSSSKRPVKNKIIQMSENKVSMYQTELKIMKELLEYGTKLINQDSNVTSEIRSKMQIFEQARTNIKEESQLYKITSDFLDHLKSRFETTGEIRRIEQEDSSNKSQSKLKKSSNIQSTGGKSNATLLKDISTSLSKPKFLQQFGKKKQTSKKNMEIDVRVSERWEEEEINSSQHISSPNSKNQSNNEIQTDSSTKKKPTISIMSGLKNRSFNKAKKQNNNIDKVVNHSTFHKQHQEIQKMDQKTLNEEEKKESESIQEKSQDVQKELKQIELKRLQSLKNDSYHSEDGQNQFTRANSEYDTNSQQDSIGQQSQINPFSEDLSTEAQDEQNTTSGKKSRFSKMQSNQADSASDCSIEVEENILKDQKKDEINENTVEEKEKESQKQEKDIQSIKEEEAQAEETPQEKKKSNPLNKLSKMNNKGSDFFKSKLQKQNNLNKYLTSTTPGKIGSSIKNNSSGQLSKTTPTEKENNTTQENKISDVKQQGDTSINLSEELNNSQNDNNQDQTRRSKEQALKQLGQTSHRLKRSSTKDNNSITQSEREIGSGTLNKGQKKSKFSKQQISYLEQSSEQNDSFQSDNKSQIQNSSFITSSSSDQEEKEQEEEGDFDYPIITEKGYYSDTEIVKLDTQKKREEIEVGLKDFDFLKLLGQGAYGGVYLVKKKKSNDLFAMKIIDCSGKLDQKYLQTLQAERNVFEIISGDYVVKAYYSFTHENYLCFVLEYMIGGDFTQVINYFGALDEFLVKFYMAELVLAIEYLHEKDIIHRDLKPDNILLDTKGHIKLADFGLSEIGFHNKFQKTKNEEEKVKLNIMQDEDDQEKNSKKDYKPQYHIDGKDKGLDDDQEGASPSPQKNQNLSGEQKEEKQKRIVGTPDYIAPEIISGISISNPSIDWWALGVIMYELLMGLPPFNDESVPKIFDNITNHRIEWPEVGYEDDCISPEAYDIINKLLNPDYKNRLGANGSEEIKNHEFFKCINFSKVRSIKAPIVPKMIMSEEDMEKREKDKVKFQKFLNDLNTKKIKQKGSDSVSDKLNKELKTLERMDLLVQLNENEGKQLNDEFEGKLKVNKDKMSKYQQTLSRIKSQKGSNIELQSKVQTVQFMENLSI